MEAVSIMNWQLPRKFAITESGRKGRDVIRSGPVLLGGEKEEVGVVLDFIRKITIFRNEYHHVSDLLLNT